MHGPAFHLHASWAGVRDPINVLCRWFVDTPEQIARWREALHLWNATHNLPATCLAQHPSQAWRCFFPRYAAASFHQDTRINGAKFFALQPARDGLVPCLFSGVNRLQGLSARFHPDGCLGTARAMGRTLRTLPTVPSVVDAIRMKFRRRSWKRKPC